jgi:D-lactate dehydrogenase (cytochrome)
MNRLQRERSDLERMARTRPESTMARNFSLTFVLFFVGSVSWFLGYQYPRDVDPTSTLPLNATRPPSYNLNPAHLEAAWADFVEIVGQENVSTVEDDIKQHATSDWSSHQSDPAHKPFCVVYPSTTEQVSRLMKICHVRRIPVVGYSGGTSLEGHYTPISE